MKRVDEMTDKQATRQELLTRIDELNRLEEMVEDEKTMEVIRARKKDLRAKLDRLA